MRYRAKRKCHADAEANANADADANRIRTKKQYVPLPFGGGHKNVNSIQEIMFTVIARSCWCVIDLAKIYRNLHFNSPTRLAGLEF